MTAELEVAERMAFPLLDTIVEQYSDCLIAVEWTKSFACASTKTYEFFYRQRRDHRRRAVGSALGCYLSKAGIKNTIFEAANHPRPHVGESMVMSSVQVFDEIGFLPVLEREGFVKKHGASWHPPVRKGEAAIAFSEFPSPHVKQDYTYHVDREKFDLLLLKHAEGLGSKVYQGVSATEVLFDDNKYARGVRMRFAEQEIDVPARMVVDASGRHTLLGKQLKVKKNDPIFDQFAVQA